MLNEQIYHIPAGEVRAFFSTDVAETLQSFEIDKAIFTDKLSQVIVQTWSSLPEQEQLIEDVLFTLADVARATWPFWYGLPATTALATLSASRIDVAALVQAQQYPRQPISTLWTKAAVQACVAGAPPLVREFTRGQQLSQLALAIDPGNLLIILAVHDQQPSSYRLLGLARIAVWLATTTAARVAVVVPAGLATHAEVESILYDAVMLPVPLLPPIEPVDETAKTKVWSIQGRPHPFSPGEQLLAARLAQDAELAPLFCFNQRIETVCQSKYWVDLLWRAGRLVIEIDGYRIHSKRAIFTQDRQRDYELLLSGYTVLRLPHDEVIADVSAALEKIRRVVHLRGQLHNRKNRPPYDD